MDAQLSSWSSFVVVVFFSSSLSSFLALEKAVGLNYKYFENYIPLNGKFGVVFFSKCIVRTKTQTTMKILFV